MVMQRCAASEQLQPDVVLMDIRMPGMDGLEAARHLAGLDDPPAVIFTTAYGDHALEAFEAYAVDYLLKPIRKSACAGALGSARRLTRAQAARWAATPAGAQPYLRARARQAATDTGAATSAFSAPTRNMSPCATAMANA